MTSSRLAVIEESNAQASQQFNMEHAVRTTTVSSHLYIGLSPSTVSVEFAIQMAVFVAERADVEEVTRDHFLAGMLIGKNSIALHILEAQGIPTQGLRSEILKALGYQGSNRDPESNFHLRPSTEITTLLQSAHDWRMQTEERWIHTGHLLLSLVQLCSQRETPPYWMALRPLQRVTAEDWKGLSER